MARQPAIGGEDVPPHLIGGEQPLLALPRHCQGVVVRGRRESSWTGGPNVGGVILRDGGGTGMAAGKLGTISTETLLAAAVTHPPQQRGD